MKNSALKMSAIEKVERILKEVADSQDIKNYEVTPDDTVLRGEGFLSEFYTGEVRNKDTGKLIKAYIKLPPLNNDPLKDDIFFNEFTFYSKIFPELVDFQREKGVKIAFNNVPKFYCGGLDKDDEHIVLQNLKDKNFVLHDKSIAVEESQIKAVFETYGQYHALTFAYKDQNPHKYEELVGPLKDIFERIITNEQVLLSVKNILEIGYKAVKEIDEGKAEKIKPLLNDIQKTCSRGLFYNGTYSSLIHGDCWSNNILFKYGATGQIEDLKLLDYQLSRNSTPVHDLAYFFYAGASKKDFDKLDKYLELYYKSFSSFLRELGSDPEKLLPFEALKTDWKTYSFLGVFMALIVWPLKLIPKLDIEDYTTNEVSLEGFRELFKKVTSSEVLKKNISDLLLHIVEYGVV